MARQQQQFPAQPQPAMGGPAAAKPKGFMGLDPMTWLMISGSFANAHQNGGRWGDALYGVAGALQDRKGRVDEDARSKAYAAATEAMQRGDMNAAVQILSQTKGLESDALSMQSRMADRTYAEQREDTLYSRDRGDQLADRDYEFGKREDWRNQDRGWQVEDREDGQRHDSALSRTRADDRDAFRPATADELAAAGLPNGTSAQVNLMTGKLEILARPSVQSGALPTEGERKFGMYQRSASRAAENMGRLEDEGYNRAGWNWKNAGSAALNALPFVNGVEFDQRAKSYDVDSSVLVESWLRARSGGAATKDEQEMYERQIKPMPGDGLDVRQQKRTLREKMVSDLEVGAGRAAMTPQGAGGTDSGPVDLSALDDAAGQAAFERLPSGTLFVAPDGQVRVKP